MPWIESKRRYWTFTVVYVKDPPSTYKIYHLQRVKDWYDPEDLVNDPWKQFRELSEMKKKAQSAQKAKAKWESQGDPFISRWPRIDEYMGDCWYEDKTPREVSKLSVILTGSGVQIQLTDPGERATAFTNALTVEDALDALEAALAGPSDPWRPWPKGFGKK